MEPLEENILTIMKTLTETASAIGGKVSEAKESMEDIARSAGKKLEAGRDETADRLHSAASSVRTTGRHGSEAIDRIASGTANKLDSAASYVEDCDLKGVFVGLRQFARRHPTGSLVAAAVIGFLAGSALSGRTHARARTTVS
jgi:ElaB/YqjD/DUF883 family membrane-anchored ribosome-binding protein